jgi:mRNA-degrading endonuclease toxin of MazEF toxin-antitoxin module
MRARDIVLGDFRDTDSGDPKIRPVLVVSTDKFNGGDDLIVLPISHSADPASPYVFPLDPNQPYWRLTGLKKIPSSIKWTKPYAIPKSLIHRRLGNLQSSVFDQVRTKLKELFS